MRKKRRRAVPGSQSDQWVRGGVPGQIGQYQIYESSFDSVADPRDLANAAGLGAQFGLPETLWVSPDARAPVRWLGAPNAADQLLQTGTLNPGVSPYQTADGTDLSSTIWDIGAGSTLRDPTVGIHDPALGDDVVLFCLCNQSEVTPVSSRIYATRVGGQGWQIFVTATIVGCVWGDAGGTITRFVLNPTATVFAAVAVIERSGQMTLYVNSVSSGGIAVPGGAQAGSGLGIGCSPSGGTAFDGQIYACGHWYGPGIGATWLANGAEQVWEFTELFTGLRPEQGENAAYARASSRLYYPVGPAGRAHILANALPPAGNSEGLGSDEQIVSVTDKNHDLVAGDLANLNARLDVGLVGTLQTEAGADLDTLQALLPWASGVVYDIDNPTGGTLYARLGNAIGAASPSWTSIRCRVLAGTIRMGFQTAAGAFTQTVAAITTGYVRSYGTATPLATDQQALEIPAGGRVRVILWCAGVGARVPDEVPSLAAFGAGSTVVQGVLTTAHTQQALAECVEVDLTPRVWGTALPTGATQPVLDGALDLIAMDGAGNMTTTDGTNTATAVITEADGVTETIKHNHGSLGIQIAQVGGVSGYNVYDGAMAGALVLQGTCRSVTGLRAYRNPRWWT